MPQLDIYANEDPASREIIPFLLDIQHALHSDLGTRLVIPLVRGVPQRQCIPRLCLSFSIGSEELTLSTPEMGAYPVANLGGKVGSLSHRRSEILAAIDFLHSGF